MPELEEILETTPFHEWGPERLRDWPRTVPLEGLACGISRLEALTLGIVMSALCPTVPFLCRSHLCTNVRLDPLTWLLASAVNQLLLSLSSGQSYFGEENQAQQACFLFYCSAGCFAQKKRSKVKQKTERAKLLHNWHKRVTKDKECSSGGQWLFWRLKWMD